jgi:hypothetical protein
VSWRTRAPGDDGGYDAPEPMPRTVYGPRFLGFSWCRVSSTLRNPSSSVVSATAALEGWGRSSATLAATRSTILAFGPVPAAPSAYWTAMTPSGVATSSPAAFQARRASAQRATPKTPAVERPPPAWRQGSPRAKRPRSGARSRGVARTGMRPRAGARVGLRVHRIVRRLQCCVARRIASSFEEDRARAPFSPAQKRRQAVRPPWRRGERQLVEST